MSFQLGPIDDGRPHFINLGAGVQSSALALMATHEEIGPMPEAAIFADTQSEPDEVYEWLAYLEPLLAFPVVRVTAGSLRDEQLRPRTRKDGTQYLRTIIPAHQKNPDGTKGFMGRRCTPDFKVRPINRWLRAHLQVPRGQKEHLAHQWLGISRDEAHRMKPSRDKWTRLCWPLVDKGTSRTDCMRWMREQGYDDPPRSACTFCPFHSDAEWQRVKEMGEETWSDVVEFERKLQALAAADPTTHGTPYLHASLKPIDEVEFDPDTGQIELFGNECAGLCGV